MTENIGFPTSVRTALRTPRMAKTLPTSVGSTSFEIADLMTEMQKVKTFTLAAF